MQLSLTLGVLLFDGEAVGWVWAGDLTDVWTEEGWVYLAIVLDLYSRRAMAWAMGSRLTEALVHDALTMALGHRQSAKGLRHHTDCGRSMSPPRLKRGSEARASQSVWVAVRTAGTIAAVESFFHTLKTELVHHRRYWTRAEAKQDILEWLEVFDNRARRHSTLGYRSPAEFEAMAKRP